MGGKGEIENEGRSEVDVDLKDKTFICPLCYWRFLTNNELT